MSVHDNNIINYKSCTGTFFISVNLCLACVFWNYITQHSLQIVDSIPLSFGHLYNVSGSPRYVLMTRVTILVLFDNVFVVDFLISSDHVTYCYFTCCVD